MNHQINKLTAFAAPVDDGIMFCAAPHPVRQSYTQKNQQGSCFRELFYTSFNGSSRVFCIVVHE